MRLSRIVDLSIVLDGGTQTYPGDPKPAIRQATTIEASGFNVLALSIGSHTGPTWMPLTTSSRAAPAWRMLTWACWPARG